MKLRNLVAAALIALATIIPFAPSAALAAQAGCVVPTTGPNNFGAVVSTYLNPCFNALLSNSSGATAPASPTAYQWWVDTSTTPRTVKVYDGTQWLAIATVDTTGHVLALNASNLKLLNSSSGTTTLQPGATGTNTLTLPAATDTLVGKATTDTLTNKSLSGATNTITAIPLTTAVTGTLPVANGGTGITSLGSGIATWLGTPSSANLAVAVTDETGAGAAVFANTPTLVTPVLGAATGTSLNLSGLTASSAVATDGSKNLVSVANTGTGSNVLATSPALVTPNLGTPSAATLTNATGLPIASGVSGLGSGVATALATPSSANLATAVTDETGTGPLVFATSPALTTPDLGTPSAATLTNATGLPLTTGTTGTLPLAKGGSGQGTAASARGPTGFNIDQATTHGDSDYSIAATDRTVTTSATLTAPRTWTLPAANAVNAGQHLLVIDGAGGINGANTLTVARAGSDTINGSTAATISGQYAGVDLVSDGVSKWSYVPASAGGGSGTVTSVTCGTGLTGGTFSVSGTCNVALGVSVQAYNATLASIAADPSILASQQIARNGSMAIAQRAMPTADNTYSLDGWRLEIENANGVVITQDTTDVPVGAGYAAKLVVGSGNNGKFGLFSPIENKDMLKLRSGVASLLVPLKATAGLTDGTGKIRICLAQWTGTADSVASDPITTWGAEGTNPTMSGSWSCANTPAAIAVTTSWVDYKVENVSISGSATNVGIFIWSDDRATTTTTDVLRIGGKVTLTQGASVPAAILLPFEVEYPRCQWLYRVIPAGVRFDQTATGAGQNIGFTVSFPEMRAAPSSSASWGSGTANISNGPFAGASASFYQAAANTSGAGPVTGILTAITLNADL